MSGRPVLGQLDLLPILLLSGETRLRAQFSIRYETVAVNRFHRHRDR